MHLPWDRSVRVTVLGAREPAVVSVGQLVYWLWTWIASWFCWPPAVTVGECLTFPLPLLSQLPAGKHQDGGED